MDGPGHQAWRRSAVGPGQISRPPPDRVLGPARTNELIGDAGSATEIGPALQHPGNDVREAADRTNSLKSTGPQTADGKLASRRNSLKHGLTGAGIVVPGEEATPVDRRCAEITGELAGDGATTARLLAERVAVLAVRLDRSVRHDFAATAERVRHAGEEFDRDERAEVDRHFEAADADPAGLVDRPAGVDLRLADLRQLRQVAAPAARGAESAPTDAALAANEQAIARLRDPAATPAPPLAPSLGSFWPGAGPPPVGPAAATIPAGKPPAPSQSRYDDRRNWPKVGRRGGPGSIRSKLWGSLRGRGAGPSPRRGERRIRGRRGGNGRAFRGARGLPPAC